MEGRFGELYPLVRGIYYATSLLLAGLQTFGLFLPQKNNLLVTI